MATTLYLAMTAEEFASVPHLSHTPAWMSCHFSPRDSGLSNLPSGFPPGSLLILDDRFPFSGHDIDRIADQLYQTAAVLACSGILLDFEKPKDPDLMAIAQRLDAAFPFPVIVTDLYAASLSGPVFLRPCPHYVHLKDHITPWAGREVWLDLAANSAAITVTENGSVCAPVHQKSVPAEGFEESQLHCHYKAETEADLVRFLLWRTREDLKTLIREAETYGIKTFVSLWQEWQ